MELEPCGACALAKAKQKKVKSVTTTRAQKPGERLFVDLCGPYTETVGGNYYWMLAVDDYTGYKWSKFMKDKSDVGEHLKPILQDNKARLKLDIKHLRCDDSGGKWKYIRELSGEFGFKMEYTAPHTPQRNGRVETRICCHHQEIGGLAMMFDAKLAPGSQATLWAEAMKTATDVGNDIPSVRGNGTPRQRWHKATGQENAQRDLQADS